MLASYSHDVTGVPEGVVEGCELRTVSGVGDLRDQHGRGVRYNYRHLMSNVQTLADASTLTGNAQTESEQEPDSL